MDSKDRKLEIDRCLDEIEAAYRNMEKHKSDKKILKAARGWVRKHKAILKELDYKGQIPRQPRIMKRYAEEKTLFTEVEDDE